MVKDSRKYEPPNGSTVRVTPLSWAMICWVRSAIRAASRVGRASASSSELVWRDWVPPSTAASACRVTRTALFSGCCAVRDTPAVCAWNRIHQERGLLAPYRPLISRAQMRRAARYLAISSKKSLWALKKNESRGANSSISRPRSREAST